MSEPKPLTIEEQKEQVRDFEYLLSQQCFHQEAIRVLSWNATVKALEARVKLLEYICHMEGADIAGYEQAERELDDEGVGTGDGIGVRSVFA